MNDYYAINMFNPKFKIDNKITYYFLSNFILVRKEFFFDDPVPTCCKYKEVIWQGEGRPKISPQKNQFRDRFWSYFTSSGGSVELKPSPNT